jgi:uncharacterized protein YjbI with pentapeptide repeats
MENPQVWWGGFTPQNRRHVTSATGGKQGGAGGYCVFPCSDISAYGVRRGPLRMINAFMEPVNSITLPISPGLFWTISILTGVALVSFLVLHLLPVSDTSRQSRLSAFIKKFEGWSGISGLTQFWKLVIRILVLILTPLFVTAVIAAYQLLGGIVYGWTAGAGATSPGLGLGALLVALIGSPFLILRTVILQSTLNTTQHGQVTDRINSAVQGLGTERIVKIPGKSGGNDITVEQSEPNMEVRIGSIYALARIARENLSFHVQIMQILCAYVRENSKAEGAVRFEMPEMPGETEDWHNAWPLWKLDLNGYFSTFKQSLKPKTDIQTVLEVLGRRTPEQQAREAGWPNSDKDGVFVFATIPELSAYPNDNDPAAHAAWAKQMAAFKSDVGKRFSDYTGYRLDLRNTNLQGNDLSKLNFRGARFDFAQMQAADLTGAQMQGADLIGAQLQGATLIAAQMQGADLMDAQMQRANLTTAQMHGAYLVNAQMQGAYLIAAQMQAVSLVAEQMQGADLSFAQMQGADLSFAQMQGANLRRAQMQAASLGNAQMQRADLSKAQMSEETDLTDAILTGALVKSVDKTTIEQLRPFWSDIFADGTVVVPEGERPAHWPTVELEYSPWDPEHSLIDIEYHKWLSNPASYTPPKPGTPD